jgi:hypothetical protein
MAAPSFRTEWSRVWRRVTILITLRVGGQAAERALGQVVALAGQAVAGGIYPALDAPTARLAGIVLGHLHTSPARRGPPGPNPGGPLRLPLTALAACLRCTLAILSEVARIILCATAAVALFAALAPGLCRTLAVVGEIS